MYVLSLILYQKSVSFFPFIFSFQSQKLSKQPRTAYIHRPTHSCFIITSTRQLRIETDCCCQPLYNDAKLGIKLECGEAYSCVNNNNNTGDLYISLLSLKTLSVIGRLISSFATTYPISGEHKEKTQNKLLYMKKKKTIEYKE